MPVRADSEWRIACEKGRELELCSVRPLAFFLCLSPVTHRNAQTGCKLFVPPCRIGRVGIVCVTVGAVQYIHTYIHANTSSSPASTPPTISLSISIGPDSAKTHGLSLYLLLPGPHGSVGAAFTRALDHIPECSSMIGLPFRHPGTLPPNHAIYSSPCIHLDLT